MQRDNSPRILLQTRNKDGTSQTGRGKFFVILKEEKPGNWVFQVDGYSNIRPRE